MVLTHNLGLLRLGIRLFHVLPRTGCGWGALPLPYGYLAASPVKLLGMLLHSSAKFMPSVWLEAGTYRSTRNAVSSVQYGYDVMAALSGPFGIHRECERRSCHTPVRSRLVAVGTSLFLWSEVRG